MSNVRFINREHHSRLAGPVSFVRIRVQRQRWRHVCQLHILCKRTVYAYCRQHSERAWKFEIRAGFLLHGFSSLPSDDLAKVQLQFQC